jgi:5'-methylthioadenosine phosphorylase
LSRRKWDVLRFVEVIGKLAHPQGSRVSCWAVVSFAFDGGTFMTARIGIIGGSGIGQALLAGIGGTPTVVETPFGRPSADPILAEWNGIPIAFLARHGVGHLIPPSSIPFRANIYALKVLGCQWILATGAVGSLREEIAPRDLVIPDQIIDKTHRRVGTFFDEAAVHVEFAEPFCPTLRGIVQSVAARTRAEGFKIHTRGTYVCMEGPAFSTKAESLMHRQWGGDLIGMTAMPEAKLAREAQISYASIALATDYDCWRPHDAAVSKEALLTEIIGNMHVATDNALALIRAVVPEVWAARDRNFYAHKALELGIWSDKARIDPAVKKKLHLLWGQYVG